MVAGTTTKIALLVFYLRISPQKYLRWGVFAAIFIILGYTFSLLFGLIFACTPIKKSFNVLVKEGHCIDVISLYIATAACNIASDVILFFLPIPMVMNLQMPLKQKLGLFFVFGIGSA